MSVMSAIKRGGSWAWNNALVTQAVGGAGLGLLSSGGSGWGALTGAIGGSVGGVAGSGLGNRAQAKAARGGSVSARKMNKASSSFGANTIEAGKSSMAFVRSNASSSFGANTRGPEGKKWMRAGGHSGGQIEVGAADMAFARSRPDKSAGLQHGNVEANVRNFGAVYNSSVRINTSPAFGGNTRGPEGTKWMRAGGHSGAQIEVGAADMAFGRFRPNKSASLQQANSRGKGQTSITNMAADAQRKQALAAQIQKQKSPTGRGGRFLGAGIGGLVGGGAVGVANSIGSSFGSGERNPYGTTFSGMGNGTVRGY